MSDEIKHEAKGNNPNIVEHGKATRFGAERGADPKEANKKLMDEIGSPAFVRPALRRLACAEFDIDKKLDSNTLTRVFAKEKAALTGAQILAIRKFQQGMANYKAMDTLIDSIDGKQIQKVAEAKVSLADLVAGSFEDGE